MVDQVFVEQDPEPDIAEPAHTTNSHIPPNQYNRDHADYNNININDKAVGINAHSESVPGHGLSTAPAPQKQSTNSKERVSPLNIAHLRSSDKVHADASTITTGTRPIVPGPAVPLDSPFAPSTVTSESQEGVNEKDVATTAVHERGANNNKEGLSVTRHRDYAYGRDDKAGQDGGAQGEAQITSADRASRGISFEDDDHEHDEEDKAPAPKISLRQCCINTVKGCPILLALPVLIPVAWGLEFAHQGDVAIFVTCLLAIIPLAGGISFATEELALRLGEVYGGLLNATFGNLVELLIAIIALVKGEIDIVQASMIGSILSNLLLVLGCSYFAGGLRFHEQMYGIPAAQMQIGLLGITLLAVALPSAYHWAYPNSVSIDSIPSGSAPTGRELQDLLQMSRGIAFILLAVYAIFLTFQLYTHAYLFRMPRTKMVHPLPGPVPKSSTVFPKPNWVASMGDSSSTSSSRDSNGPFRRFRRWSVRSRSEHPDENDREVDRATIDQRLSPSVSLDPTVPHSAHQQHITIVEPNGSMHRRSPNLMPMDPPAPGARTPTEAAARINLKGGNPLTSAAMRQLEASSAAEQGVIGAADEEATKENPGHGDPVITIWFALGLLTLVTVLAGVTAEFLVSSIDGLTTQSGVSREFVGLILLPVIGNSVEHITAVTVSVKDKLNLSMSIAIGSSIQVSLCILPILVLVAWPLGQPLTMYFDPFETITLVVAVLLVNFAISDGRTNYLEGFVMMMAYVCIALVCWFYNPIR